MFFLDDVGSMGDIGPLFFYLALVLGIICIGLVVAVLALVRKSTAEKGHPDRNEDPFEGMMKEFSDLKEFVESVADFARGVSTDQKEELRRYQEGFTLAARRKLIIGVIEAIDYIDSQKLLGLEGRGEGLDTTRSYLKALLFNHGIAEFRPPVGESYNYHVRKNSRLESEVMDSEELDKLGLDPTSTDKPSGEILEVIYSGYRVEEQELEDANNIIIRPAQVMVASAKKTHEHSD